MKWKLYRLNVNMLGIISTIYEQFGFPPLVIDTEISTSESNQEYEHFLIAKQKEDQERGMQALLEMQKRDEKEASDGHEHTGPLVIGLTIRDDAEFRRIEEIVDEERRVAIEGYVFSAETKELRSGRTLLPLKLQIIRAQFLLKCSLVIRKMQCFSGLSKKECG